MKVLSFGAKSTVKIALMIVPFYQGSGSETKLQPYSKGEVADIHQHFLQEINPAPNWTCLWYLQKKHQTTIEYADQRFELYPCVSMIAMVEPVDIG